jgi:hypothetical protein
MRAGGDITTTSGGSTTMDANGNSIVIGNGLADNIILNATDSIDLNGSQSVALSSANGNVNLIPFNNGTTELGAVYVNKTAINVGDGILNAGTINATTFVGALTGNATTATTATTATSATTVAITEDNTTTTALYPVFVSNNTGNLALKVDKTTTPLSYTPSTGEFLSQSFAATITNGTVFSRMSSTQILVASVPSNIVTIDSNQITVFTSGVGTTTITPSSVTATTFNGNLSGTATNATNVGITSDNTAGTYYIPFVKTSGTGNKPLFIDDITGPLSYNPSTAVLSVGTATFTSQITVPNSLSAATFSSPTLTCNFNSFSTGVFSVTLTANMTAIAFTNGRIGGQYVIYVTVASGGPFTIASTLTGTTNRRNYTTAVSVTTTTTALLTVTFDGTRYIIACSAYN